MGTSTSQYGLGFFIFTKPESKIEEKELLQFNILTFEQALGESLSLVSDGQVYIDSQQKILIRRTLTAIVYFLKMSYMQS